MNAGSRRAVAASVAALVAAIASDGRAAPKARELGRCGPITAVGCCVEDTLLYCEKRRLKALDCSERRSCGWRPQGMYDCGTSGAGDPARKHPRFCPRGAVPAQVLAAATKPRSCGGIPVEGCCDGDSLKYCDRGRVRVIDCSLNRFCGWRGVGQLYNCGTEGKADPQGKHPRTCPGAKPPDKPPVFPPAPGSGKPDGGARAQPRGKGCRCELGSEPVPGPALWLLLLGLSLARRRP